MKFKIWGHARSERGRFIAAHAAGGLVLAAWQLVGFLFSGLKLSLFCKPAAFLASLFLGTGMMEVPGGFLLPHPLIDVQVIEACSGFDFFSLLLAALCGIAVRNSRSFLHLASLLPLAFVISVGANCARVVCSVQARLYSDLLPGLSAHAAHLAVGICVFVTVLAATCHTAQSIYAKP